MNANYQLFLWNHQMMRLKAKEHDPPHIHAIYGERSGIYVISNSKRIKGNLPKRAEKMVEEFIKKNKTELLEMWNTQELTKLPPLE